MNVPVLVNYYLVKGLAIKTGVQVGFHVFCKEHIDGYYIAVEHEKNKVAFSIPIGISYEWRKIVLDARYTLGFTDMISNPGESSKNRAFSVTLGYKFTL